MTLYEYIYEAEKITHSEFARKAGCSESQVSRLITGNRRPGIDLAIAIHDATDGQVSLDDWRITDDTA